MQSVIDLIVAAAEKKELMDKFRKATSPEDLQNLFKPYSISVEDCKKLLDARAKILETLKDPRVGCY